MADYQSTLTGQQMDDALLQMNQRLPEQWTTGQIDGVDVPSSNPRYHNNAKYYSQQAEQHAEDIEDLTASATTLPAGSQATVTKTHPTGQPYNLAFGIPQGSKGDTGDDGVSPTLSSSKVGKTTTITYTDATHPTPTVLATILDGQDGSGTGDMLKATYDNDSTVANAGGIKPYVEGHHDSTKQDSLPTTVNDRYLHTNSTTGALEWSEVQQGGGTWGSITGTLSNQTDLQNELTNKQNLILTSSEMATAGFHNGIFRGKDITSYYQDGTLWKRINGTDGYSLFEDLYIGDYFRMSRPISAYEQTQTYQTTGSQYVTIADFDGMMGNGSASAVTYHHIVCVPGQGAVGTQHFGRSRMNATNVTTGGYQGSEMFTTTLGAVTSSGSTATTATINQQLYAEFGSHLKTTNELLSNATNATGYNRFGTNGGCSNNWSWANVQAVLMSEVEVYGSVVWSSSGYDTGTANRQLSLFRLSKNAINNRSAYYWFKDVASSARFCRSSRYGYADYDLACDVTNYVRPRFILG